MLVGGYVHGVAGLDVEGFVEGGELAECAIGAVEGWRVRVGTGCLFFCLVGYELAPHVRKLEEETLVGCVAVYHCILFIGICIFKRFVAYGYAA